MITIRTLLLIFFLGFSVQLKAWELFFCGLSDSTEHFNVGRSVEKKFLWRRRIVFYDTSGIKRSKSVWKRPLSNIFKNKWLRGFNARFKYWNEDGKLIHKGWARPLASAGKRKDLYIEYHENGTIKMKRYRKKDGGRWLTLNKKWEKIYDERGKRIEFSRDW